ncbi:hypothetical protein G7092_21500 [Mucilaginibacter sp. HC2]|uniref:hypothetical protein n=1 Tax=Mucilaginibacter inviolabilis TaxID=2714892 RepID=UPI00140BE534|nr:hypothetical protein [Mucilaginibacter inviolabilis]NHA06400.1 hypothetical protein [Mucilaginibacter inviolabilis]
MKKLILLIPVLLLSLSVIAQINPKDSVIRHFNDIGNTLVVYYHPNADSLKNNCWEGCVFIRFNINKEHQFVNIAYTASTPTFIKDAIAQAFTKINQNGANTNQLMTTSDKTYILPLIVVHREGCGFMTGWEDKNYKPDKKMAITYERRQMRFEQFSNSIGNMTNFTDGNFDFVVDCVLLKPARTPVILY